MNLISLGHQGWLVSSGETNVLIDPVLAEDFGHSEGIRFYIYPLRRIDISKIEISAIILTNHHPDHFNIKSFSCLDNDIPVFFGELMPASVSDCVAELGFSSIRLLEGEWFETGSIKFTLYRGGRESEPWEQRVYQPYLSSTASSDSVFIQSDALISDLLYSDMANGLPPPRCVVCTNNSQILSEGGRFGFENLLPMQRSDQIWTGIQILDQVIGDVARSFGPQTGLILCGCGYLPALEGHDKFLWADQSALAEIACKLSILRKIYGATPGASFCISDLGVVPKEPVDWIHPVLESPEKEYIGMKCNKPLLAGRYPGEEMDLQNELGRLAPIVIMSRLGRNAFSLHKWVGKTLGSKRIIFRFISEVVAQKTIQYALDFQTGKFELDTTPADKMLTTYAYGVEMYLTDFLGIFRGRLQVWELATCGMRQWYVGSLADSPAAFFYTVYGEHARPDLARLVHQRKCANLRDES